ncbi:alpha/beta fold hydrolase [Bradyrhizobium sp.]|uniref:alpha/beta fold hydrolase n=1 Tax=Bradyrhizobium sp. TaxID=376 RepID=UPI002B696C08|nr:alpha/beta hydrolase [Bradyrhizobium sp.]HMM92709.1 alpha/beta hydrolase [Bradyrhizobium sp.]
MQTLAVNGYDMAYLDIGRGMADSPPLVLVHGTLGDFRTWNAVLGPLSKRHRVVSLSLRRFFPEHWDGVGNDYRMAQHVDDVIGFIEKLHSGPVDLVGHSRGGHIGFRVAQARPDLLRRLVLAEPGGDLEPALQPANSPPGPVPAGPRVPAAAEMVRNGDIDGALALFVDGIDGEGTWARLPAVPRQLLRDNIFTLLGQVDENRKPFLKGEAEAIRTPTLLIGGGDTKGGLSVIWRVLAEHIPGARTAIIPGTRHWMFEQAPQEFCDAVLDFLAA